MANENTILPSNLVNNDESTIPHQEEEATDTCSISNFNISLQIILIT